MSELTGTIAGMKIVLSSMVDAALDEASDNGILREACGNPLLKLKEALDAESKKIEAALKTHPKFFIQKL